MRACVAQGQDVARLAVRQLIDVLEPRGRGGRGRSGSFGSGGLLCLDRGQAVLDTRRSVLAAAGLAILASLNFALPDALVQPLLKAGGICLLTGDSLSGRLCCHLSASGLVIARGGGGADEVTDDTNQRDQQATRRSRSGA